MYPDTFIKSVGLEIGPFRLSSVAILFVISAPSIVLYAWSNQASLKLKALDYLIVTLMAYLVIRGLATTFEANIWGLVVAYALYALLLYFGVAVLGQKYGVINTVFITLSVASVLIAAYALLEFILNENIIYGDLIKEMVPGNVRFNRSGSTLAHPVALGIFLLQTSPFIIFFYVRARSIKKRLLIGAAIVLNALALEVTFTKGAWISAGILGFVALAYVILKRPKERKPVILLTLAVCAATTLLFINNRSTFQYSVTSEDRVNISVVNRVYLWDLSLDIIKNNPVFGEGMYRGPIAIQEITNQRNDFHLKKPLAPGNLYLTILMENGIVGFLLAGCTLFLLFREAYILIRKKGVYIWVIPILFSISGLFIHGMSSGTIMVWPIMVTFWMCAGMLRAVSELGKEPGNQWSV